MLQMLMPAVAMLSAGADLDRAVDARILKHALSAPESRRKAGEGPRYCVFDSGRAVAGNGQRQSVPQRVCRTYREWTALGVQPLTS
ncbi:hypothetical protein [Sphingomonas lenta]|uniref:Uncharacterized protein n=1 Tax=Sphingomonas lenta TaxID=1141887 RepID=A0A2A2SHF7_9SPHN|nr:hypothetical protein [Sphingomonas lenta]PAX08686.1 hypothetical protein CKY28_04770 [Sphingomonas lenta]